MNATQILEQVLSGKLTPDAAAKLLPSSGAGFQDNRTHFKSFGQSPRKLNGVGCLAVQVSSGQCAIALAVGADLDTMAHLLGKPGALGCFMAKICTLFCCVRGEGIFPLNAILFYE